MLAVNNIKKDVSFKANIEVTQRANKILKGQLGLINGTIDMSVKLDNIDKTVSKTKQKLDIAKYKQNAVDSFLKKLKTYSEKHNVKGNIKLSGNKDGDLVVTYIDKTRNFSTSTIIKNITLYSSKFSMTKPTLYSHSHVKNFRLTEIPAIKMILNACAIK